MYAVHISLTYLIGLEYHEWNLTAAMPITYLKNSVQREKYGEKYTEMPSLYEKVWRYQVAINLQTVQQICIFWTLWKRSSGPKTINSSERERRIPIRIPFILNCKHSLHFKTPSSFTKKKFNLDYNWNPWSNCIQFRLSDLAIKE